MDFSTSMSMLLGAQIRFLFSWTAQSGSVRVSHSPRRTLCRATPDLSSSRLDRQCPAVRT
ncbi:hypothetical protein M5D96_001307 [Drosophila gunungcola]|uniref:Uncharacterized protein n=1 Tax=Drosophila gunungcola TaxID=103775 RepID=A0A9P9YYJ5_9MUSC|nr:hypothetical protein M5D96_001307 [Drosophila gunungcola]